MKLQISRFPRKVLLLALPLCALLATPHLSFAQTNAEATSIQSTLERYQLALDQIAHGNLEAAGMQCADGIAAGGNTSDLSLLLTYIRDRQGRKELAINAADGAARTSPLAAAYSAKLKTTAVISPHTSTATASRATSTATATAVRQGDARLARIEELLLGYVNEARHKEGLAALANNARLAEISRAHSAEMRDRNYFAHESPTSHLREPLDRYLAVFDRSPRLIAENIFRAWGSRRQVSDSDALRAHNSLMNSPGHRSNIMLAGITQIGIGVVANDNGDIWVTQMFLKP